MNNLPSYLQFVFESVFGDEYAILEYEEKDMRRIKDMLSKSKGDLNRMAGYAATMAKSITDAKKAVRRGEAAEYFFGKQGERTPNPIADIFYERAKNLGVDPDDEITQTAAAHTANPRVDFGGKSGGVIFLPTFSAMAIWDGEITGQLSDGAWENSGPQDHWKFWSDLEVRHGKPEVQSSGLWCKKNGYNLASLIEYVGDRMIAKGRMARAAGKPLTTEQCEAAEYMPKDFEHWKLSSNDGVWQYDFVFKYMKHVPEALAKKFYSTTYTERDLREDLRVIKLAMATART